MVELAGLVRFDLVEAHVKRLQTCPDSGTVQHGGLVADRLRVFLRKEFS